MEKLYTLFKETTGVCTDSRAIKKDSLFIALVGENFNGNNYISQAIQQGAKYAITSDVQLANDVTVFYVPDTLIFLQKLANYHRKQFSIPIIGITGSNGKTTTKELIAVVLSTTYSTLYTIGNLNNHIGVPLTILQLTNEHEIAIIEMGANKPGDIKELVDIAEPTHGIITNIGSAHLEGFGSLEGVIKTKTELYDFIKQNNGKLVINNDDSTLLNNCSTYTNKVTYSSINTSNVKGELVGLTPFVEFKWATASYHSELLSTKIVGKYNFYNFLAAICFGIEFNVLPERLNKALCSYTPTNNRSQIEKTASNTLILDAYNANPTSVLSALESFDLINHEKKSVILGDMLELGKDAQKEHQNIIDFLKLKNWNCFLVGSIYSSLSDTNSIPTFEETSALVSHFEKHKLKDNLILVKGSRGIKLETIVPYL